jgi:hypothetical protein
VKVNNSTNINKTINHLYHQANEHSGVKLMKLLPIRRDQIINICGYPLHGIDSELLMHLPPDIVISEYGIQVSHSI